MKKSGFVRAALFGAAFFVIFDGIWLVVSAPAGDKTLAFALIIGGIFMIIAGYTIALESGN